jgi:hypothetical protein
MTGAKSTARGAMSFALGHGISHSWYGDHRGSDDATHKSAYLA